MVKYFRVVSFNFCHEEPLHFYTPMRDVTDIYMEVELLEHPGMGNYKRQFFKPDEVRIVTHDRGLMNALHELALNHGYMTITFPQASEGYTIDTEGFTIIEPKQIESRLDDSD